MKRFWDNYSTDAARRKDIYASPLQATTAQLKGLPPALIQIAEFDVLRDEGQAYGRKLNTVGVDDSVTQSSGMIYNFGLLNVINQISGTRSAMLQASSELKRHLQ